MEKISSDEAITQEIGFQMSKHLKLRNVPYHVPINV